MMPAGRMISWSALASIRSWCPPEGWLSGVRPWRVSVRRRGRVSGESAARVPTASHRGLGPCRPAASVTRRSFAGQTQRGARGLCTHRRGRHGPGRPPRNGPQRSPYTAGLVSQRPALGCLFEIVETLVLTLIIFFVIQNFVAQPYKVQQQSMERTLEPEQYVLVDKLTPRFDAYKRGDIVVFHPPADWGQDADARSSSGSSARPATRRDPRRRPRLHQRRAARRAVPLQRRARRAAAADHRARSSRRAGRSREASCFLMGDHRSNSADSRTFGPVAGRPDHRAGVAALLADRHVRGPGRRRPTRTSPRPHRDRAR